MVNTQFKLRYALGIPAVALGSLVVAENFGRSSEPTVEPLEVVVDSAQVASQLDDSFCGKEDYVAAPNFETDSDEVLFARLIYGEARGESREIKNAIADSVLNRTGKRKWWGNSLREVILKENQYSCFNTKDDNFEKINDPLRYENEAVWQGGLDVVRHTLSPKNIDSSNGATHYYDDSIPEPFWAKGKTPVLVLDKRDGGKVRFYKLDR